MLHTERLNLEPDNTGQVCGCVTVVQDVEAQMVVQEELDFLQGTQQQAAWSATPLVEGSLQRELLQQSRGTRPTKQQATAAPQGTAADVAASYHGGYTAEVLLRQLHMIAAACKLLALYLESHAQHTFCPSRVALKPT
jgi:hypothetical protein